MFFNRLKTKNSKSLNWKQNGIYTNYRSTQIWIIFIFKKECCNKTDKTIYWYYEFIKPLPQPSKTQNNWNLGSATKQRICHSGFKLGVKEPP